MRSSVWERLGRASARVFGVLIVGRLILEASRLDSFAGISDVLFVVAALMAVVAGFIVLRAIFPERLSSKR